MSITVNLPDEVARRLEVAAAERGQTLEEFALAVLAQHAPQTPSSTGPRRLAFAGVGESESGVTDRIEEMLADGFGRD